MPQQRFHTILIPVIGALVGLTTGCASSSHPPRLVTQPSDYYRNVGLTSPTPLTTVMARCVPPIGWIPQPLKSSERHTHQFWLSPTGRTAYGVIHFKLPWPVGIDLVHWEFLREMKKREGEAVELSRREDPTLPGLRFVCEGGRYKMRVNLVVDGFDGWASYAGTERAFPEEPAELELAEQAKENTSFGLAEPVQSAKSE